MSTSCKLENRRDLCVLHGHDMAREPDATQCEDCGMAALRRLVAELEARLARYEAPGPALLTAEHAEDCNKVTGLDRSGCTCGLGAKVLAYREQHARCVAVVQAMLDGQFVPDGLDPGQRRRIQMEHARDAVAIRRVLAALTEEKP